MKKNKNQVKRPNKPLITLNSTPFIYFDTEYEINDFGIHSAKLSTIQYAKFTLKDLLENKKPRLTILPRWYYRTEKELLLKAKPIWKSMFLGLREPGRTIPIGFCIFNDIELLRAKYKNINEENRTFFDLWRNSRAIDIKMFAIQKTGLIDPRLGTYNSFLKSSIEIIDGNEVANIVRTINRTTDEVLLESQKNKLREYIHGEFTEQFNIYRQLFRSDYTFKPDSVEYRALKLQEERTNQKMRMKRDLSKRGKKRKSVDKKI